MTGNAHGDVLIVGGSGMLARASRYIAADSGKLTLGSRNPGALAGELGAVPLVLDWTDPAMARAALKTIAPVDLLVSWLHDGGIWLAELAEAKLKPQGRSIRIHGALSRKPAVKAARDPNPRPDVQRQIVILGWVNEGETRRWLTNDEISDAVIEAVQHPARKDVVAGVLDD
jgi:hypothetical protein